MSTSNFKGITYSGLQGTAFGGPTFRDFNGLKAEIDAAAANFGANTIRLQVQQQMLVGFDGKQFDSAFFSRILETVNYVLGKGLTCVINCQTEIANGKGGCPYPNAVAGATDAFWFNVGPVFGATPNVIFDVFNEPDCKPSHRGGDWNVWRKSFNQTIANLRLLPNCGTTPIWVDCDSWADGGFEGCPGVIDPGNALTYSFHHPAGDPSTWNRFVGKWAETHPVVNGEFAQNTTEFNWNSPLVVQQFFAYCAAKGIGHTIWTNTAPFFDIFDANLHPAGWWGNMVAYQYGAKLGGQTILTPKWQENYRLRQDDRVKHMRGLYQGWSKLHDSELIGAAGFEGTIAAALAGKTGVTVHAAFGCKNAKAQSGTAVIGVHGANAPDPVHETGLHAQLDKVRVPGVEDGGYYSADLPSTLTTGLTNGTYRGVCFGVTDKSTEYQNRFEDLQLVIDHA